MKCSLYKRGILQFAVDWDMKINIHLLNYIKIKRNNINQVFIK